MAPATPAESDRMQTILTLLALAVIFGLGAVYISRKVRSTMEQTKAREKARTAQFLAEAARMAAAIAPDATSTETAPSPALSPTSLGTSSVNAAPAPEPPADVRPGIAADSDMADFFVSTIPTPEPDAPVAQTSPAAAGAMKGPLSAPGVPHPTPHDDLAVRLEEAAQMVRAHATALTSTADVSSEVLGTVVDAITRFQAAQASTGSQGAEVR